MEPLDRKTMITAVAYGIIAAAAIILHNIIINLYPYFRL